MSEEQPSWLNEPPPPGAYENQNQNENQQYNKSSSSSSVNVTAADISKAYWVQMSTRGLILILTVLMAWTGCEGLAGVADESARVADFFVSFYMLLFSILLFTFEITQIQDWCNLELIFKRNFGFLYGIFSKSLFLIFVAFLAFSIEATQDIGLATGVLLCFFGVVFILIYLMKPEWYEIDPNASPGSSYNPPSMP